MPKRYIEPEQMTNGELVEKILERHTPTEIPPCRVCGGKLSIGSIGGGGPTVWACSTMEDDPDRPGHLRYKEGRSCGDDHYGQSRFEDHRHTDGLALELARRMGKYLMEKDRDEGC
jgi:hypothetical protein